MSVMEEALTSEMEEFLLNCYIASVIKVAIKQVKRSINQHNKKVHFGSQIVASMHEYTNYLPEQFDDTLPIEEGLYDYCPEDLNMDSLSSQEELFDIHKDFWSEKGCHGYEDTQELASEEEDENIKNVDTYEDFIKGAHKRICPSDVTDCLTSSPDKKKKRIEDVDSIDDLQTSHPDEESPKMHDTLMYLKYHVFSYAMDVHQKSLSTNGKNFPNADSENAKLFWNMCSKEQTESDISKPSNVSEGLTLAQQILKQQTNEKKSIRISNSLSKHDFENESSYVRFLNKDRKVEPLNVNVNNNEPSIEQPMRRYPVQQNEIRSYLLPEMTEDSPKEIDLVSGGICYLQPENISTYFTHPFHQAIEPTFSPIPTLNDTSFEEVNEEEQRKQEMRFRKALSFTQEDTPIEDLVEGQHDDHTVPNAMLDLINGGTDEDDFNEFQFTQTQSLDEETPEKVNENGEDRYSVNHMLAELMASQAFWGTQQYQGADYDEDTLEGDEDGVVPAGLNQELNQQTSQCKSQRKGPAAEQRYQYHSTTPAFCCHSKSRSPFDHNNEGDAVVPGASSAERLFHLHYSPITTPQKLRLGLSKKMKVRRSLLNKKL